MNHFPSYTINHWPGCAKAKMQAVQTADRKWCAATTAMASYLTTGKLYGTLAGSSQDEISDWILGVCRDHMVLPSNMDAWVDSLTGRPFEGEIDRRVKGLGPKESDIELDDYQVNAIRNLRYAGGVIGAFMGAGKTAMAVVACRTNMAHERASSPVDLPGRCWIVCPLNAMPAWELAKKHELSRYFREVKILSVDSAHKYVSVADGDCLIIDEVHRASHNTARRTQSLHKIRSRFRFCVCLTGTLVHAGVVASLSIKDLAVPGMALYAKTYTCGETYNCLVKKKIGQRTVTDLVKPPEAGGHKEAFMEWLSFGVQLLTADSKEVQSAFKLPGQELQEVTLGDPWPSLEEDVARVANQVFEETGEFPHAQEVAHLLARDGLDKKIDWLAGELEGIAPGEPVVIFAQYRASLDAAEDFLRDLGRPYVRVDGDVVGADRAEAQRKFQSGEAVVFLGQIHAASESMNLQVASISLTLDVSWSCIDYSQALCRTHRRGQDRPCIHLDLVANRLQARILDRLRAGQDFASECSEYQEIQKCLPQTKLAPL